MQGAAQVFVVDYIPERLDLVKNIGAIPILRKKLKAEKQ
jgi:glutathione-independent formaldehyde dehydrogenase